MSKFGWGTKRMKRWPRFSKIPNSKLTVIGQVPEAGHGYYLMCDCGRVIINQPTNTTRRAARFKQERGQPYGCGVCNYKVRKLPRRCPCGETNPKKFPLHLSRECVRCNRRAHRNGRCACGRAIFRSRPCECKGAKVSA